MPRTWAHRLVRVFRRMILTELPPGDSHGSEVRQEPLSAGTPGGGGEMSHSYETGRAISELGSKQPHELLLMLGGLLAVLLTLAKYGIQWATPPGIASSQYGTVATALVINVVLGGALWASSAISRKNLMNGAIVAAVISLVLIYYGGQSGQIGGVVGIFGAILAAAKPYLPWSRRDPE